MSERKAKALAFAIALAIAALPASAKTATPKPKPTPTPKATTWTAAQIQSLITKTLDAAVGKFVGPPGPPGPQGPAGAIVSTYPANPSANSNGGSIAGFSQLSASNLTVDQATSTKTLNVGQALTTQGLSVSDNTATANLTITGLTNQNCLGTNAGGVVGAGTCGGGGASPAGPAGCVQIYSGANALGCGDGTLPATIGPPESTLPALLQGYTLPTSALITSIGGFEPLGVESYGTSAIYGVVLGNGGANNFPIAIQGDAYAGADGQQAAAFYTNVVDANGFAASNLYGMWVKPFLVDGGSANATFAFYSSEQTAAANNYYSWFDSRGVGRCKEDNTFNGVGQSICVVYNPQFQKYAPGATNFERIVYGQWNSNVAEIGPQAGGTGTLQPLRLLGSQLDVPGHINTASSNNDFDGQISISSATSASHTFASVFNSPPVCTLTPTSDPSATGPYWVTASTSDVTANVSSSGSITFNYHCVGNPN